MNKSNVAQQAKTTNVLPPAQGILQRRCACGNQTVADKKCAACAKKENSLQRKLAIGASNDPLEREADRVANQVMAMSAKSNIGRTPPRIQRLTGQPTGQIDTAPASVDHVLASSGRPLEPALRKEMEQRFSHDFSKVRVHSGGAAEQSARDVNAHAYTARHNVVFGRGQFSPGTYGGRRLLAHELTHVVQQSGLQGKRIDQEDEKHGLSSLSQKGQGTTPEVHLRQGNLSSIQIQRDLATPPPATAASAQPNLTVGQIDIAIKFNRVRYDALSTRLIQDIVGTKPTGTWITDDIQAIASLQEEYGFTKDGMVGPKFFRFLDEEIRKEKLSKTDKNCLLSFRVISRPQTVGPVAGGSRSITGQFNVRAQFSKHCRCPDYEYRQFIRGHWRRERGGVVTDLGNTFTTLPGGAGLPAAFIEDGNTTTPALNYGHRTQPGEASNHYLDDKGTEDQANGCNYRSSDTPGGPDSVVAGDVFDIDVNFRGEIQRRGRVVRTLHWVAIRGRFPVP